MVSLAVRGRTQGQSCSSLQIKSYLIKSFKLYELILLFPCTFSPHPQQKTISQLHKNRPYWEDACLPIPFHTLRLRLLPSAPTPALCTQAMEALAGCLPSPRPALMSCRWPSRALYKALGPRCREQSAPTKQLGSLQACGALLSLPLPRSWGNSAFLASTLARRLCADCWPRITSSINRGFISSGIF